MSAGSMAKSDRLTALVTGSTDGVGQLVAVRLAASGANVLLHGRHESRGRAVMDEIRRGSRDQRVDFHRADFASLDEVRALAREIADGHDRIDVLINNAGIGFGPPGAVRETSRDGHELRFAVNYLAPFLLTHLLLPGMRRGAAVRIVNVASIGQAPLDFDDLMLASHYDGRLAYSRSKLALVMFTVDLAAALQGANATVNAVHPATFMNTKMVTEAGIRPQSTIEEGADAIVRLALSPDVAGVSGRFFNGVRESRALDAAYDPVARRRLRQLTLDLVGLCAQEGADA
jgi:NAD(P)-dependent dehydrogenase (short-subunit alcohol dehydrogenase family)